MAAAGATAQPVVFLAPERAVAGPGEPVEIRVVAREWAAGAAGAAQPAPWPSDRAAWMFVRGGGDQTNLHDVRPAEGGPADPFRGVLARVAPEGTTIVGVDLAPISLELTPAEYTERLTELVGPGVVVPKPGGNGRIAMRREESAATILRSTRAEGTTIVATQKTGQRTEIRALHDPTGTPVGSDIFVRVYAANDGYKNCRVLATHVPTGERRVLEANNSAIALLSLTAPGAWQLEVHHVRVEESPGGQVAVWSTGTLSFDVPAQEAK